MHQSREQAGLDPDRLAALDELDILDTQREECFDRIARLVKLSLGVDAAVVSFMDAHRQWYKAAAGTANPEVPLEEAFCSHLLCNTGPIAVPDASMDERFARNPHVTATNGVRFYAGVPLRTSEGHVVGSICGFDSSPRVTTDREIGILLEFAELTMTELELRRQASSDLLTGLSSRRAFKEDGEKYIALARRHGTALSLVAFDLDHFKHINDSYGHGVGDRVLAAVGKAAKAVLRRSDLIGRIGGEEFCALLPHTDLDNAVEVAGKLRESFETLTFAGGPASFGVTASFGVAALDPENDIEEIMHKADQALYESKREGRNRVSVWRPSGKPKAGDRHRGLRAGRVVVDNGLTAFDCTIRSIWETGAEIMVSSSARIPDSLSLIIHPDNSGWPARVVARDDTRIELEFETASANSAV